MASQGQWSPNWIRFDSFGGGGGRRRKSGNVVLESGCCCCCHGQFRSFQGNIPPLSVGKIRTQLIYQHCNKLKCRTITRMGNIHGMMGNEPGAAAGTECIHQDPSGGGWVDGFPGVLRMNGTGMIGPFLKCWSDDQRGVIGSSQ